MITFRRRLRDAGRHLLRYRVSDHLDALRREVANLETTLTSPPAGILGRRHVYDGDDVSHLREENIQ